MKKKLAIASLALAIAAPLGGLAYSTEPETPAAAVPVRPAPDVRQRQVASLMQRYEKVGLTEEQKNQLRPLVKSQVEELRAIRMDSSLTEEERQTRARATLAEYRSRIEANLTPQQITRLQEIREANRKAVRQAATQKPRGPAVDEE